MIEHHAAPEPAPRGTKQRVLNESWPLRDENGPHARGIRDQDRIPVRVRLVLERDGVIELDGHATRWHGRSVCVTVWDERLLVTHVWVDAGDVVRR